MDDRNNQLIILGHVCLPLSVKIGIGLAPVKIRIGLAPGQRLEVGEGQSQEKFFRSEGGGRSRTKREVKTSF